MARAPWLGAMEIVLGKVNRGAVQADVGVIPWGRGVLYAAAGVRSRDFQNVPRGTFLPEERGCRGHSSAANEFCPSGGTENVPRGTILISTHGIVPRETTCIPS